jgi:hypothetical protein
MTINTDNWLSAQDCMPTPEHPVLAVYDTKYGRFIVRAMYIPRFHKEDIGDYEGDCEYDEDNDEYYWPEGWYEWSQEAEINYKLGEKVTHWMELPKLPPMD